MGTADTNTLTTLMPEEETLTYGGEDGEEESSDQSFVTLYNSVLTNEDVIFVIDKEAEEALKKGLIAVKYKANKAAAYAETPTDKRSLEFQIVPWSKEELADPDYVEGKIKIQVWLKAKQSIRVHRIIITDKEF